MQTTKSSPFSSFDQNYYAALRRISFEQAEAYRQQVVSGQKHTIDLGKSLGQINEVQALGIQNINPEQEKIEQEVYEQQVTKAGTIDLAAKYENGGIVPENMHTIQSKNIQKEVEERKTIDLAKLIENPEELTEEMVEEVVGGSTAAEEATAAVIEDAIQDEVITEEEVAEERDPVHDKLLAETLNSGFDTTSLPSSTGAVDTVDAQSDKLDAEVDAEIDATTQKTQEETLPVATGLEDTVALQETPSQVPSNFTKKSK